MTIPPDQLDLQAVRQANEQLWANHTKLNRRLLTMGKDDTEYRKEWMRLYRQALTKRPAPPPPKVVPKPVPPPAPVSTRPIVECPVAAMTHEQKMEQAISMANLSPAVKAAIGDSKTIVATLAVSMGIIIGAGAAAAATGVGAIAEVVGAILLVGGAALAGYQIGTGISQLIDFYNKTRCDRARTLADLEDAGCDFANGVSNMGVGAFMLLLSLAGAKGKGVLGEKLPVKGLPDSELVGRAGDAKDPSFVRPEERGIKPDGTVREGSPPTPPGMQEGRPGQPIKLEPGKKYLYSVMPDGTIRVAEADVPFETTVDGEQVKVPRTAHPNLTEGGRAKMSGELNYDPDTGKWIMDNSSGRYGGGRTSENLDAAADLLGRTGTDAPIETNFHDW